MENEIKARQAKEQKIGENPPNLPSIQIKDNYELCTCITIAPRIFHRSIENSDKV
jgi:hypothetical protein